MSLDSNAYAALWALFDAGGPRPEYVLPVLWEESNFSSTIINNIGCAGLNQACAGLLGQLGVDAATYASWPASEQIRRGLTLYMLAYAPLNSATRVMQANFLPATLSKATSIGDVLTRQGEAFYDANTGLDADHNGAITVGDLAAVMAKATSNPHVQNAIAAAYALRPGESPKDPVYGDDFTHPNTKAAIIAFGILTAAAVGIYGLEAGWFDELLGFKPQRRRRMLQA